MSFIERFAKKDTSGGNSKNHGIMLESAKQMQEDLALQVSKETSSSQNIGLALTKGNDAFVDKTEAETSLENEIDENSSSSFIKAIELATSKQELESLASQYEELLAGWNEKSGLLRSEKHLKEYLAIQAALGILQQMLMNPELMIGKGLAAQLQSSLQAQMQSIAQQAQQMLQMNLQGKQLAMQLAQSEQALRAAIEALKQDPGKLNPAQLQETLQSLQDSLRQIQEMREAMQSGKQPNLQQILENLQNIQAQNQGLIQSGLLSSAVLNALQQSQLALQQSQLSAQSLQSLQSNISQLQSAQMSQILDASRLPLNQAQAMEQSQKAPENMDYARLLSNISSAMPENSIGRSMVYDVLSAVVVNQQLARGALDAMQVNMTVVAQQAIIQQSQPSMAAQQLSQTAEIQAAQQIQVVSQQTPPIQAMQHAEHASQRLTLESVSQSKLDSIVNQSVANDLSVNQAVQAAVNSVAGNKDFWTNVVGGQQIYQNLKSLWQLTEPTQNKLRKVSWGEALSCAHASHYKNNINIT